MDIMTIILACIGSGGLFAFAQFLLNRYFDKKDGRDEVRQTLKLLVNKANVSDLNDSRIQLLILINHFPKDHQAILNEAENYFIKMQGDSWVAGIVTKWAEQENVDIEYIKRAHEATLARQGQNNN